MQTQKGREPEVLKISKSLSRKEAEDASTPMLMTDGNYLARILAATERLSVAPCARQRNHVS
jgi:hypothetical protein